MLESAVPPTSPPPTAIPARAGVGLKAEHYRTILSARPDIGFFEVHAENYMGAGGPTHHALARIRQDHPVSLHGVCMSIGGPQPLDAGHLGRFKSLVERYEPALVSEHLAWSTHETAFFNDLLPLPYTPATLARVAEHIDEVQSTIGRAILLENPSTYLVFRESTMSETDFLAAVAAGHASVDDGVDLVCLGEMGIGNTTSAAALAAALFGGETAGWTGRGTGVDDAGLGRKISAIDRALSLHGDRTGDPLALAAALGGRELAAILGGTLKARQLGVPVLLDGFVCTAAVAPLAILEPTGLAHTLAAHVSAEAGHRGLLAALGLEPLLDLGMRLGEGSGACLAVNILRSALECHRGMASFAEAGVSEKPRA